MIVCKFGGSATAHSEAIENIKKLKDEKKKRNVFVFSAIGKNNKNDTKLTDLLIEITKKVEKNENFDVLKSKIVSKLKWLKDKTSSSLNIEKYVEDIIDLYKKTKDFNFFVSRGEYITAYMMSKFLDIKFVHAKKILYFKNGKIDETKTQQALNKFLAKYKRIVVPGFYGADENGKTFLLTRGGGDVTGAIITKLTGTKTYENWTDVNGIMQVNPSLTASKQIYKMNFLDLEFMTTFDATVVHKDCAKILQETDAKLKIGSIFQPYSTPTIVLKKCKEKNLYICYKENYDNVAIYVHNKNNTVETYEIQHGNLKKKVKEIYSSKSK